MSSLFLQGYPKSCRLLNKQDFEYLKKDSKKILVYPIVCYFKDSQESKPGPRIAFSVSRKIGKSHQRNRYKRILKEVFRLNPTIKKKSLDLLFVITRTPDSEHQLKKSFTKIIETV